MQELLRWGPGRRSLSAPGVSYTWRRECLGRAVEEGDEVADLVVGQVERGHDALREPRHDVCVGIFDRLCGVFLHASTVRLLRVGGHVVEVRPDRARRARRLERVARRTA